MNKYQVVVGNVGTVYDGNNVREAMRVYRTYRVESMFGKGRASGEQVTLFEDGDIRRLHLFDALKESEEWSDEEE